MKRELKDVNTRLTQVSTCVVLDNPGHDRILGQVIEASVCQTREDRGRQE